ncbi:MAG: PDZ domain-containing protein [Planctomycetota bacterium]|nr:PDZ domain-containing protein [Planctomycetota bacterium]
MKSKVNQHSIRFGTYCVPRNQHIASGQTPICRIRWLANAFFLAIFSLCHTQLCLSQNDVSDSFKKEVKSWIEDLGSDNYSTRQVAALRLSKCKEDAIPFLTEAASVATGEKSDRLFQFLSSVASDPYSDSGKRAFDSLNELAASRTTGKAIRAEKILRVIGAEQREAAVRLLDTLKVSLRDRELQVMSSRVYEKQPLVIDRKFTGTGDDLACLKWLTDVEFARLEGTQISRQVLKHVIALPHLRKLQLIETNLTVEDLVILKDAPDLDLLEFVYSPIGDESVDLLLKLPVWGNLYLFGTKLSSSGQQSLKSQLDGIELFISRGGFLGVQANGNSAVINEVVRGGAAEAAGLRKNDRMLSVNGVPIQLFDDLRKQLAKFADGESVVIEIERKERISDGQEKAPSLEFRFDFPMQGPYELKKLQVPVTLGKRSDITRDR